MDGETRRKLSKRKDPEASLTFYREQGYHPLAVKTYMMTLLNSNFEEWMLKFPDKPLDEFRYSIGKMGKSGALFDILKLNDVAKSVMSGLSENEMYEFLKSWADEYGTETEKGFFADEEYVLKVLALCMGVGGKKRRKDFVFAKQAVGMISYFFDSAFAPKYAYRFDSALVKCVLKDFKGVYDAADDSAAWFARVKEIASQNEFAADMKAYKNAPSTACPSPDEYAALMEKSEESFVVTLSGKLSGSYNAACVGREMVLERSPEKKIHIFDSESASAGETLIALMLRDRIDGGHSFEDIVAEMTAFIARMKTRFVLEDLSNLVKNGRISKVAGLLSGMLSLRPIMGDDGHGSIAAIEKVRGTQNAMRRLVELIAEGTREAAASSLTMVLSYCNCPERALMLKKEFLEKCAALREVILVPTSGLSTVYAYDGGIVLAY